MCFLLEVLNFLIAYEANRSILPPHTNSHSCVPDSPVRIALLPSPSLRRVSEWAAVHVHALASPLRAALMAPQRLLRPRPLLLLLLRSRRSLQRRAIRLTLTTAPIGSDPVSMMVELAGLRGR